MKINLNTAKYPILQFLQTFLPSWEIVVWRAKQMEKDVILRVRLQMDVDSFWGNGWYANHTLYNRIFNYKGIVVWT